METTEEINKILEQLPFNTYEDIFNAVNNNKASFKFKFSTAFQISNLTKPICTTLGLFVGFLLTSIFTIVLSMYFNYYLLLLLLPINFILACVINNLKLPKKVAWICFIVNLFLIKLPYPIFIESINIILLYFFNAIWWTFISQNAINIMHDNQSVFLYAWYNFGLLIEDIMGNSYFYNPYIPTDMANKTDYYTENTNL